jgi:subtilisin family serine protease
VFRHGAVDAGVKILLEHGFTVVESGATAESQVSESDLGTADVLVFRNLEIGILAGARDSLKRISDLVSADPSGPIVAVTRERVVKALNSPAGASQVLDATATWGLNVTGIATSRFSGRGVRIAMLDTGLDMRHPDFSGRVFGAFTPIPNTNPQDVNGHGTQCTGIAAGPTVPSAAPRYGAAGNCEIHVAKVLTDAGIGAQGWVIAGCDWAVARGCRVICLALQDAVSPGEPPDPVYEALGRKCLASGTLLIAAAGNKSNRSIGSLRPVSSPANCVSIMAVGAVGILNGQMRVAEFSDAGGNGPGSDVDIAAPGVSIGSSCPLPLEYTIGSGTSQAAAFVTGIAAMLLEQNPALSAVDLWRAVTQTARRIPFPSSDVGSGLVQAPQ